METRLPTPLKFRSIAISTLVLATAWGSTSSLAAEPPEAAPRKSACIASLPSDATCYTGRDSAGAFYTLVMPGQWNGRLVLHAHGGPTLGDPTPERSVEDITRWAVVVKAGYAWAGSTFRQGGVAVRAAAEDTERVRRIFRDHVAKPRLTILHGQSWGAPVAIQAAEMFTRETVGERPYDAVLLTSGVLAGGTRSYDVRTDLRVVYQYLCNNHPRPTEAQYPLPLGLPAGATLRQSDLAARVNECLGLDKPAAQRSPEQARKVATIVNVIKIPATSIQAHLNWATFHFQEISSRRTGGASPFGNIGAVYRGSDDDQTLNAGVLRFAADPAAYWRLAQDTDHTGKIAVPVLTAKWISDPTAFAELDAHFRDTMQQGGSGDRLVQTFVSRAESHSYFSDPVYPTLLSALTDWAEKGLKPTAASIAAACPAFESRFGAGCSFAPEYQPPALATRVPERQRPGRP